MAGTPRSTKTWGCLVTDKALKKIVLRQFHGEGFVNEYAEGEGLEFVTVRIENVPAGWKAKESYRFVTRDEFVETFSLAARLKRAKQ